MYDVAAKQSVGLHRFQSLLFSERERFILSPVRLSSACLSSVCRLSVTFVRPTQAVQIFGNISMALGT